MDKGLEADELGGMIQWAEPTTLASELVILYRAYWSGDFTGAGRQQVDADVVAGTNQLLLPPETNVSSFTHLAVYTPSTW